MLRRFLLWILREDLPTATRLMEIEQEWTKMLQSMAAAAAREGRAAKRALKKATEPETHVPATTKPPQTRKAALRERAAAARGLFVVGGGRIPEAVHDESGNQNQ